MKRLTVIAFAALSACATPQEQCISAASRDARIVGELIKEVEANLARGYALETTLVLEKDWVDCTPPPTAENPTPEPDMCLVDVPVERTRPVAIDLNAEAAKLASLRQQQSRMLAGAEAVVAECRALYPE